MPKQVPLDRNARRPPRRRVPVAGLLGTREAWVEPEPAEGVGELRRASADGWGGWRVERARPSAEPPGCGAGLPT